MSLRFLVETAAVLASLLVTSELAFAEVTTPRLNQVYIAIALNDRMLDGRFRVLRLTHDRYGYSFHAHAGCNHLSGGIGFATGNRNARVGGGRTEMYCKNRMGIENRMDIEREYFDALLQTSRWRIEPDLLIFEGDKGVLKFEIASEAESAKWIKQWGRPQRD